MITQLQRYSGPVLGLLMALSFTLMDTMAVRCMRRGLGPMQVVFLRMALTFPVLITFIAVRNPSHFRQLDPRDRHPITLADGGLVEAESPSQHSSSTQARLIWLRGLLDSACLYFVYASLRLVPIAEFSSVWMIRTFVIGLVCWLLLKETFGWRLQIAAVISSIVTVIILRPPFFYGSPGSSETPDKFLGVFFCIVSLLFDAVGVLILRAVGPGVDPSLATLAYTTSCLLLAPSFIWITSEPLSGPYDLQMLVELSLVAAFGFLAQICQAMAIRTQSGGTLGMFSYAQIPFATIIQSFLFMKAPTIAQCIGMLAIVISGVWAVISENHAAEGAKSQLRVGLGERESLLSD